MRKGLFAIVLVAAAFAGGAVVNGPGLQWARTLILKQVSSAVESEEPGEPDSELPAVAPVAESESTTSTAPKLAESAASADDLLSSAKQKREKGATRRPAVSNAKGARALAEPKAPEPSELALSESPNPAALGPPAKPASTSTQVPTPLDELPPLKLSKEQASPSQAEAPADLPPPLSPSLTSPAPPAPLVLDDPRTPPTAAPTIGAPTTRNGQDQAWADAPDSAPATAVPPKGYRQPTDRDSSTAPAGTLATASNSTDSLPTSPSASRSLGDWTEIRRQMRDLGVSRYGIEGEPNGRVRFHCIIPIAGKRAVGQQFEAEGTDEIQAARTTLRRVALWRATENSPER